MLAFLHLQKATIAAAAKKAKDPLKAKKNAPNNSMSDIGEISIVSDGDVDMAGSGNDDDETERVSPVVQQAKGPQKTASEMYQKV